MNRFTQILMLTLFPVVGATLFAGCMSDGNERENRAKSECKTILHAAFAFQEKMDRPPSPLSELAEPPGGRTRYLDSDFLIDPWGKPYQIETREDGWIEIATVTPSGQRIAAAGWVGKKGK